MSRVRSDEPALKDLLGRQDYVSALAEVVRTCDTPLCLSVFGTWGTGKTSLMLAALDDTDAQEVVEEEIADLEQRQADARREESLANDEIAALCDPEPDCDTLPEPGSSTPLWALLISGAILVGGAGVLTTSLRGRQ